MKIEYLIGSVLLIALSGGCSTQSEDGQYGQGSMSFVCQPQSEIGEITRSTYELASSVIPSTQEFSLELTGEYLDSQTGSEMSYSSYYDSISEYLDELPMLTTGDYIASIAYGDSTVESSTNACFQGRLTFEVIARKESEETITATLSNSVIRIATTEWFDNYYSDAQFTVTTSRGNEFSFTPNDGVAIYVEAGSTLTLGGVATKSQTGSEVTFTESVIGSTKAGMMNTILVDAQSAGGTNINITFDDTLTEISSEIELNPES